MSKYTIGIDFGTLSARAVVVDVSNGAEVGACEMDYPHGVISDRLVFDDSIIKMPRSWALQDGQDYIDALFTVVPGAVNMAVEKNGISIDDIIAIGSDFTSCTVIPADKKGMPISSYPKYRGNLHSYVKLWKHHGAASQASRITNLARQRKEPWLDNYGGNISSEWLFPKLLDIYENAPEIYEATDVFVEGTDWVPWILTGRLTRNTSSLGYKAMWNDIDGYPDKSFLNELSDGFGNVIEDKLKGEIMPIASCAGSLLPEVAVRLGLRAGIAVCVGNPDGHVCAPATKVTGPGKVFAIIGTSAVYMAMSKELHHIKGICGTVKNGVLPGYYGYEAGQSCCGDHFSWFTKNCIPESYTDMAREQGISIHELLRTKAQTLSPGESGLLALDWWNGNRNVLCDSDLTGVILGLNLNTKPEEIYRCLIEAVAFGARKIIDTYRENGIKVDSLYAGGGIAHKDPMMMQIYANVLNCPVYISGSLQACALGSSIFAAVCAGSKRGGWDNFSQAAEKMGALKDLVYLPQSSEVNIYDKLYKEYEKLHDYFGRGENDVLKTLREINKV